MSRHVFVCLFIHPFIYFLLLTIAVKFLCSNVGVSCHIDSESYFICGYLGLEDFFFTLVIAEELSVPGSRWRYKESIKVTEKEFKKL